MPRLSQLKEKNLLYPYLFAVLDKDNNFSHFTVKIATSDYEAVDTEWMGDDENLPEGRTLKPSMDVEKKTFRFKSEKEAIQFIQKFWIELDLDKFY